MKRSLPEHANFCLNTVAEIFLTFKATNWSLKSILSGWFVACIASFSSEPKVFLNARPIFRAAVNRKIAFCSLAMSPSLVKRFIKKKCAHGWSCGQENWKTLGPGRSAPAYGAFLVSKFKPPIQTFDPSIQIWNCLVQTFDPSISTFNPSVQIWNGSIQAYDPSIQIWNCLVQTFDPSIQTFNPSMQIWSCSFQTFDPSSQTLFYSIQKCHSSIQTLDTSNQTFHPSIHTCTS